MRYYSGVDGGKRAIEPYQVSAAFSNALSGSTLGSSIAC